MDVIQVSQDIKALIDAIRDEGKNSPDLIEQKAEAMCSYDKALGKSVAALKASGTAVSIIRDIAKEKVCNCLYNKIIAEESLKAHWHRLEYLKAQLNGYQSINRHLSER